MWAGVQALVATKGPFGLRSMIRAICELVLLYRTGRCLYCARAHIIEHACNIKYLAEVNRDVDHIALGRIALRQASQKFCQLCIENLRTSL